MDDAERVRLGKFLSLVLRHRPHSIGITLDPAGWADVTELLARCAAAGPTIDRAQLDEIVRRCPKQRFAFDATGRRIRASQGHSVEVALDYPPSTPPELLFHGTSRSRLAAVLRDGLLPMGRHHVHLSVDVATAELVGRRRGDPVVLRVRAGEMHAAGHVFCRSANGVWLVDRVPPAYLDRHPSGGDTRNQQAS